MSTQLPTSIINSSFISSFISPISFDGSMLDPITFEPMTTCGFPDEAGRPMSCVQTGFTVGEKTLHQLEQDPITRDPIIMAQWHPNFALIACIEEFITKQKLPPQSSVPVS